MFGKNKRQKELEKTLEDIKKERERLEKAKDELLKIQQMMNSSVNDDRIDICDVYVWRHKGICSLVRLEVKNIMGENIVGDEVEGFESTLTDIFTNRIIYTKNSIDPIKEWEPINNGNSSYWATLTPIYKEEHDLIVYIDKKVPRYVLQQLYYKLNNINLSEINIDKNLIK